MNSRLFGSCRRLWGKRQASWIDWGGLASTTGTRAADGEVVGDLEGGLEHDAAAGEGPAGQDVAVVGLERALDLEAAGAVGGR